MNNPIFKPTVIFCIPGNRFSDKFLQSWTYTLLSLQSKYNIHLSNKYSSQVNFARALCLGANVLSGPDQHPFQKKIKYDVIIWLDSDMVFNPNMIDKLIQTCFYKHKVFSGIYAMEGGGELLCCVENWDVEYYKKNGSFQFLSVKEGEKYIQQQKSTINCAYVGMGCMAIRFGVLEDERIKYPWFFRNITTFEDNGKIITDGTSEDVSFIRNLIESNVIDNVVVDLSLRFGHEKTVVI